MPNENKPDETQGVPAQSDAATTPIDLASAFKMLNQANREAAQEPVDGGSGNQQDLEQQTGNSAEREDEPGSAEGEVAATPVSEGQGSGADDDGYSDGIEAIDFNAYKQEMLRDIQRNAATSVRKEFEQQNIGYYSAAELTVRDEQTGQVRFRNPDVQDERDPNYYFKSRAEMQQFIQAWNQGVDYEYRKAVNEKQRELLMQETPKAQLIDFIPKFQAMDPATQKVFDALLEGHEINDASGKPIGFNVNLDAVAAQAARIAKSFGGGSQNVKQANQQDSASEVPAASSPALDMHTGNGQAADEKEPTSIGEALAMLDKKNKEKK